MLARRLYKELTLMDGVSQLVIEGLMLEMIGETARHKENRNGEKFLCIICGRAGDADTVGAQIVLARTLATLGSVESPRL